MNHFIFETKDLPDKFVKIPNDAVKPLEFIKDEYHLKKNNYTQVYNDTYIPKFLLHMLSKELKTKNITQEINKYFIEAK